ncbi:MAG: 2-C-methyl-D-erythritol 4-phosphate cytidylyltransferase [Bacteroidetes bacterium]|nr:2-C-methyl-D-erythritol 4-phosphate cytidylyltransferase [Bacteroidota bacterium]
MKRTAIIVAGGSGSRLNSDIPKQFLLLNFKPILFYSIERFAACSAEIILVMNAQYLNYWNELISKYNLTVPHALINGGDVRAQSVLNGLRAVQSMDGIVAVHDAARPLVSEKLINHCYDACQVNGSAIPIIPVADSIRNITSRKNKAVNRDEYFLVQTPQCYPASELMAAFNKVEYRKFTDEASMMEAVGYTNFMVHGEADNFKITRERDLLIANAICKGI